MNVFHCYLEAVKASCFRDLNLCAKLLSQVFKNYAIRGSKEGQNIFYEVFFLLVEFLPVFEVLVKVDLVSSPKRSQMLFVHFIDGVVLYGEEYESLWVLSEYGLLLFLRCEGGSHANSNDYISNLVAVINQISRHFMFDL